MANIFLFEWAGFSCVGWERANKLHFFGCEPIHCIYIYIYIFFFYLFFLQSILQSRFRLAYYISLRMYRGGEYLTCDS